MLCFRKQKTQNKKEAKANPVTTQSVKAIEKEVLNEVAALRAEKKKTQPTIKPKKALQAPLKIGDKVRLIEGRAVGTIDSIEKQQAVVNYGQFTTHVGLEKLEKV